MGLISRVSSRTYRTTHMAQKAINKRPLVKKRNKKFRRNQADRFDRVGDSWRSPKGIDSALRRRFSGQAKMPNIDELNCLMMSNRTWACEIAAGVSSKKRKLIVERAAALNVHVTNSKAKLRTEENE